MFADAFHGRALRHTDAETRKRFLRLSRRREIFAWITMIAFWFIVSALAGGWAFLFLEKLGAIARLACGGTVFAVGVALWLKTSREIGKTGVPERRFEGKVLCCSKLFYVLARWCLAAGVVSIFDFVSIGFSDDSLSWEVYLATLLPFSAQTIKALSFGDFSCVLEQIVSGDFFSCGNFAEWLLITFLLPSAIFFRGLFLFLPLSAFFFRVAGTKEYLSRKKSGLL